MMTKVAVRKRLSRHEAQVQTRKRLVDAARGLFVRHGFGGTSLRDIAEEAGYSQGAFYSNFPCKEAVLLDILKRHLALEEKQLDAIVGNGEHGAEQVLAALGKWFEKFETDRDWSILTVELQLHALRSPTFAESYSRFWLEHEQRVADLVSQTFARCGKVVPVDPAQLAAGLMALSNGLAVQESAKCPPRIAATISLFLQSLLAAAPVPNNRTC
jgi:AcrR family transcriptional regulator